MRNLVPRKNFRRLCQKYFAFITKRDLGNKTIREKTKMKFVSIVRAHDWATDTRPK